MLIAPGQVNFVVPGGTAAGNSIGGVVFEFLDEWWKSPTGPAYSQETNEDAPMPFPDGWASEEWFGLVSQGDGSHSPFYRRPRRAYELLRDELWKSE